jgi:hypothetical protein
MQPGFALERAFGGVSRGDESLAPCAKAVLKRRFAAGDRLVSGLDNLLRAL